MKHNATYFAERSFVSKRDGGNEIARARDSEPSAAKVLSEEGYECVNATKAEKRSGERADKLALSEFCNPSATSCRFSSVSEAIATTQLGYKSLKHVGQSGNPLDEPNSDFESQIHRRLL